MPRAEKQPFGTSTLDTLQQKYTQNRISWGTATEESLSEPILNHLKTKGLTKGIPPAFMYMYRYVRRFTASIDPKGEGYSSSFSAIASAFFLADGAVQFILIAAGCRFGDVLTKYKKGS